MVALKDKWKAEMSVLAKGWLMVVSLVGTRAAMKVGKKACKMVEQMALLRVVEKVVE